LAISVVETKRNVLQRPAVWVAAALGFLIGIAVLWTSNVLRDPAAQPLPPEPQTKLSQSARVVPSGGLTQIYAHNLRLHQGPNFRVYIQWLRGTLQPAHPGVSPSFDESESFYINVTDGVMRMNLGDISNYLSAQMAKGSLRNVRMTGNGPQVKLTGMLHKMMMTLPIELNGIIKPTANNRIQIHVTKINVLKVPFKAMLRVFHVTLADFMPPGQVSGVEVNDNDIYFDPQLLLPPPHIKGSLTAISIGSPDLEAVYGASGRNDSERVEGWRNFLRLQHGSLSFGKLTMHDVDLMMVDISQDPWFDLDLANYQEQLVSGYTRITPQQGLQIFMPDASELKKGKPLDTSIQWFKNRNAAPPSEVVRKQ